MCGKTINDQVISFRHRLTFFGFVFIRQVSPLHLNLLIRIESQKNFCRKLPKKIRIIMDSIVVRNFEEDLGLGLGQRFSQYEYENTGGGDG